ncbi:hypothetical protein JCM9279_006451 [Rhodotorula babjevae]
MSGSDTQHLLSILRGTAAAPGPPPPAGPTSTTAPRSPQHGQSGAQAAPQDQSGVKPAAPLATTDSLLALFSRRRPSSADSSQQASPQPRTAQEVPGSMHPLRQHQQPQPHAPTSPMTRRSSDLLSLLQGTHASPAQLQQDQAAGSSHAPTNCDAPTSPASPPGGNASQLLGLLMGGGGGGGSRAAHNGSSSAEHASPTSTRPPPLSSVPSHIRALSPASGSDTSEATTAPTTLTPGRPASAAGDGPISHAHLAAQYLVPDAPPPLGAPVGLRLPRSAHPPQEPQHLSISLSAAHVEALAPSLPPTTPITLLALAASFPGARRAAGTWERGIAYATGGGKGRVRVIDRDSGARVLLKGGKGGDVRELRVAPYAVEGRRRVATVAEDGAVVVWEVADSFDSEEEARTRRMRELDLPSSASLVRFSPDSSAQTLVIVDLSSTMHLVSLDGKVEPRRLEHDGVIADLTYSADGKLLAVVDRTGRYTVYSVDGHKVERSGSVPLASGAEVDQVALLEPAQGDGHAPLALAVSSQQGTLVSIVSLDQAGEASDITFSAPPGTANAWGALAYHRETQSLLVSHSLRGSIYAFRLTFAPGTSQGVRIEHVVEQPTAEPILSFVLDPLASADPHAAAPSSTATVDPDVPPSTATSSTPPLPQLSFGALVLHPRGVSHVGLVGSVPRPPSRPPTPSTAGTATDDDDEPHLAAMATAAGRRMSLEGSIYVASEVSVRVDEPETDELSLKVALPPVSSPSPLSSPPRSATEPGPRDAQLRAASSFGSYSLSPPRAAEPALGDLGNGISGARTPVGEAPSGSAGAGPDASSSSSPSPLFNVGSGGGGGGGERIRLAGPVVNAAIRSMKARQQHAASSAALASPALSPIASAPTSVSGGDSGSEREQGQDQGLTAGKEKRREARGQHGEAGARELRRLESSLPSKVATAVSRELDKHFQQLVQHSTAAASSSSSRDQALLATVQQAVTASVAQAVESALIHQVGGVVEQAVRAQMGRTVEEVISRALPLELEKQLGRPALSFALSSSIASTIAPPLERHLTGTLVKLVVPALEQKLTDAVAGVVSSIHSEMVGVRKEIVQEQSGAVGILEDEVASLRQEVSQLKAMMEQMHALVLRQSSESRSAAPSASPRVPQQPPSLAQHSPLYPHAHQQYQQPPQQRRISQPFVSAAPPPPAAVVAAASHPQPGPSSAMPVAMHALPPIPRVATPHERYEELFTEAMQPQHEPSFVSLQHLVASSPLSRIEAVFPPPPALPKISMAVVLSLAYRLSQVVADRQGPLDDEGKKLLLWLRKAIAACDGKQPPDLLALIPRILTNVVENLVVRGRALMALQDLAGANDVRLVQQYAHARLSLFAQPGAGEGFEQFRR